MISLGKLIVSTSTNDTCDSQVSRLCTASKFVGPWAILEEDNLSPYILGGVKYAVSEHNGGFQRHYSVISLFHCQRCGGILVSGLAASMLL